MRRRPGGLPRTLEEIEGVSSAGPSSPVGAPETARSRAWVNPKVLIDPATAKVIPVPPETDD